MTFSVWNAVLYEFLVFTVYFGHGSKFTYLLYYASDMHGLVWGEPELTHVCISYDSDTRCVHLHGDNDSIW